MKVYSVSNKRPALKLKVCFGKRLKGDINERRGSEIVEKTVSGAV